MKVGDLSIGNQLQCCDGRWTWESCVRKSVIDYMLFGKAIEVVEMVVEDSGKLDVGSDHNPIWREVIWGRREVRRESGINGEWMVSETGGISGGSREVFIRCEEEVRELEQETGRGMVEMWSRWKEKVIGCSGESNR